MLTNYLIHNEINTDILDDAPLFFKSLLENVKFRLDDIDLECEFISDTDIAFDTIYNKTQFIIKNNVIIKDEHNIKMLEQIFKVNRGVPFLFIMTRYNAGGHVVWAIKMGNLPIIICRQQANISNCPIIFGYDKILDYLHNMKILGIKYMFNILDTSAPIKFGNLHIVNPVGTLDVEKFITGAAESSSDSQ